MEAHDQLLIYEQAGPGHAAPMLWSFSLASGTLTRIMTGPPGASLGGGVSQDNINGFSYVPVAVQEPYAGVASARARASEPGSFGTSATWGYLGPMKNAARAASTNCGGFAEVQVGACRADALFRHSVRSASCSRCLPRLQHS